MTKWCLGGTGFSLCFFLLTLPLFSQSSVTITVNAAAPGPPLQPIWTYFGYDEPNYTYSANGRKLITELAESSPTPVYIRTHNLLTTGDGTASLKWGSTNAYTEDAAGKPIYNWTIVDRIIDTYLHLHAKPFIEVGFAPEALSTHPEPYRHNFPNGDIFTGWSYRPNNSQKWSALIQTWVRHEIARHGRAEVLTWYWEFWNEPDIRYWQGTPEEYDDFYELTARAIKSVLPQARVGGPATTGPASPKAAAFLRQFLEYCGARHVPLDFISYHAKGSPQLVDGHVRMAPQRELGDVEAGMRIVRAFPQFQGLPVFLTEADPEGCAACSARTHPQNAYRNGPLYAAYTAFELEAMYHLAERHHANLQGMLTWAFEFEDQPYFEGFRTLSTNGIDKPILNLFRMLGFLSGSRLRVMRSAAQAQEINALATRSPRGVSLLVWNYQDDDPANSESAAPESPVRILVNRLPPAAARLQLTHYRIDSLHSNAYAAWKAMGSPQHPSASERAALEAAGQLQLLESPRWLAAEKGVADIHFTLPSESVSLLQLTW
jgi:xylan 1,4-beta-xylosidase